MAASAQRLVHQMHILLNIKDGLEYECSTELLQDALRWTNLCLLGELHDPGFNDCSSFQTLSTVDIHAQIFNRAGYCALGRLYPRANRAIDLSCDLIMRGRLASQLLPFQTPLHLQAGFVLLPANCLAPHSLLVMLSLSIGCTQRMGPAGQHSVPVCQAVQLHLQSLPPSSPPSSSRQVTAQHTTYRRTLCNWPPTSDPPACPPPPTHTCHHTTALKVPG
jgi:hypothetical protein